MSTPPAYQEQKRLRSSTVSTGVSVLDHRRQREIPHRRRVEQQLERDLRFRLCRGPSATTAAGFPPARVARDREPCCVGAEFGGVLHGPPGGRPDILGPGGEWIFGRQPVVHRHDEGSGADGERARLNVVESRLPRQKPPPEVHVKLRSATRHVRPVRPDRIGPPGPSNLAVLGLHRLKLLWQIMIVHLRESLACCTDSSSVSSPEGPLSNFCRIGIDRRP